MSLMEAPAEKQPLPAGVGQPEGFVEEGMEQGDWALKHEVEAVE